MASTPGTRFISARRLRPFRPGSEHGRAVIVGIRPEQVSYADEVPGSPAVLFATAETVECCSQSDPTAWAVRCTLSAEISA